ncbi:MAG: response regulator, partial [Desulfobacteraceae bacterium]|nr:response regulator [Desulfobacteraceae bacterium]
GGIAHDFNNILNIIIGNTELLLVKVPSSSSFSHHIESIKEASLRAADIVRQLLSFSKKSKQSLKPVQIGELLKDVIRLIKSTLPSSVEIVPQINIKTKVVMADPVQMNQIFLNLCINASQSMDQNTGIIKINVDSYNLIESKQPGFTGLKQGEYLRITFSDNGRGIPASIIDRIFDPYFTTKEIGHGSGIGLAVVHGIVKNHNGHIDVESKPGKGTSFFVYLPVVDVKPEIDEDRPPSNVPTGKESILLVDDEELILEMAEDVLGRLGYSVHKAQSPLKAFEMFKNKPEGFDLVITDMTMPQMTGLVLAKKIHNISPQMPVIVCTGYSELIDGKTAWELNLAEIIMKPIRLADMAQKVRFVLDGR